MPLLRYLTKPGLRPIETKPYWRFTVRSGNMRRYLLFFLALGLCLVVSSTASAQHARSLRIGLSSVAETPVQRPPMFASSTPRWVKWGVAGAVGGAILFSVAGQSNTDRDRSAIGDAALGAAIGFVIVGGAIALYDAVCAPESGSRRAGLCGR